jgi:transposase
VESLDGFLEENEGRRPKERATLLRIFGDLRDLGYTGGYDAVRRHAARWRAGRGPGGGAAFIPLSFDPGEACQFDWSGEVVVLGRANTKASVAHFRLCYSRMRFVRAYPLERQEMLFDAHHLAFQFFGGSCRRGIYDNLKTAVDGVFAGKERVFNRRFVQMCSHYMVEPTACTPRAGWEKGQVENQVGAVRKLAFAPRARADSLEALNERLLAICIEDAKSRIHPDFKDRTVWDVFQEERGHLIPWAGPFEGFRETTAAVTRTCLVHFDRNRYSVASGAAGRPVQVRAYAGRVEMRLDGILVGSHPRVFGRDQTVYDPWHYLRPLLRKPGALRNGAPFKDWNLPPGLAEARRRIAGTNEGDRQFVGILAAVARDGLPAVEKACLEARAGGHCSRDVVLNILSRQREGPLPGPMDVPTFLALAIEPSADCGRYDSLLVKGGHHGEK